MCIALAGFALNACGSDAKDSSAVTAAGTDQTSAAGKDESPATSAADDVVTIPAAGEGDVSQQICDGIGFVLADMAAIPGAAAAMYGPELVVKLSDVLVENEFDEEAVKTTCPTEYAEFLKQAQTTSLFGVSAP